MESLLVNFDKNKTNKIYFIITTIKFDLKMSQSQHSGSIVSADNAEIKYKKALKEISKLKQIDEAVRKNYMGGKDIDNYLSQLLTEIGLTMTTFAEMEIVKNIK